MYTFQVFLGLVLLGSICLMYPFPQPHIAELGMALYFLASIYMLLLALNVLAQTAKKYFVPRNKKRSLV